jgi:hypothetical protein
MKENFCRQEFNWERYTNGLGKKDNFRVITAKNADQK